MEWLHARFLHRGLGVQSPPDASRPIARDTGTTLRDTGPISRDTGPFNHVIPNPYLISRDTGPILHDTGPITCDTGPKSRDTGPKFCDTGPIPLRPKQELTQT